MIIWIASYPKSGNTWVRAIINSLLFSKDNQININNLKVRQFPLRKDFEGIISNFKDEKEFAKNCILAQERLNIDNKIKFFKTHNAFWKLGEYAFTNESNTLGVIHVVRDPRNVVTSIMNHFSKTINNYEKAFKFINDTRRMFGPETSTFKENDLPTIISSWSNHYNSWQKFRKNNLLIKYENLLENPEVEYLKVSNFLKKLINFKIEEQDIHKIIKNTQFEELKDQENKDGFREAAKDQNDKERQFFYLGPKNKWENLLDKNIKDLIEKNFEKEMRELDYL